MPAPAGHLARLDPGRAQAGEADGGAESVASARVCVLGPLVVTANGADVPIDGALPRRLLAALAVAAAEGQPVGVDDLIDVLYDERQPQRPRRALSMHIWRLRAALGESVITGDGTGYRLNLAACEVDGAQFEQLLRQGRGHIRERRYGEAVHVLRASMQLWRGTPLAEYQVSALMRASAQRWEELHLGAVEALAEATAGAGDRRAAITMLEDLLADHPGREHCWALLIDLWLGTGDRAAARRCYDTARRFLIEQGVEPGSEIEAAAQRITQAPAAATVDGPLTSGAQAGVGITLVGRERELATVVQAARAAIRSAHATLLAVVGEPGIGKSALVRAAVQAVAGSDSAPRVVRVQCDPRRDLPYAPLAELADLAGPDKAAAEELVPVLRPARAVGPDVGGLNHVKIVDALTSVVRDAAADHGVVIVVEDAHWAPPQTVRTLLELAGACSGSPVVVLVTVRNPAEMPAELRDALDALVSTAEHTLRLTGLDEAATAQLLEESETTGRVRQLRRLTGGNPLYLYHLRRAGDPVNAIADTGIDAAITTHLRAVPVEVTDALQVAAVVGAQFDLTILSALPEPFRLPRPVWGEHLDTATRLGLVQRDPDDRDGFGFTHALIRDHLYERMPAQRRARVHAGIGRAMDRISLSRARPSDLIAHHYAQGWPFATTHEVAEKLREAARAATVQLDFAQAARHGRAAAEYLAMDPDGADPRALAETLGAAARSYAAGNDLPEAQALFFSQRTVAERAGLVDARIAAALGAVRTQIGGSADLRTADDLVAALNVVAEDHAALARSDPGLLAEAVAAVQIYRPNQARRLLREIVTVAPSRAAAMRTALWEYQDPPTMLATARELVADPNADPVRARLRLWVSEAMAGRRRLGDPPPTGVAISTGSDLARLEVRMWRITVAIATGRFAQAVMAIENALRAPRPADAAEASRRVAAAYAQRAYLALLRGEPDSSELAKALWNPQWPLRHPVMPYIVTYLRAFNGDRDVVRSRCDELMQDIADGTIPDSDLIVRLGLLGHAAVESNHEECMRFCLERLRPHRGQQVILHFAQYWGSVTWCIGNIESALGDLDTGIDSLERATHEHRRCGSRIHEAQGLRDLACRLRMRGRQGDRAAAERYWQQALGIAEQIGLATTRWSTLPGAPQVPR